MGAEMTAHFYGLIGALLFLIVGLAELGLFQSLVYPALRRRHETAKLTASQGPDPSRYLSLIQFQSLVILPVIGFMLGDRIKTLLE
jgi:hypothetical protein